MAIAAVLTKVGKPLEIHPDVMVSDPGDNELQVQIVASGVCHSDLSMRNGTIQTACPIVLGHEGAGVVIKAGARVEGIEAGDHIVVSWIPQCGNCYFCRHGQPYLCELAKGPLLNGTMPDGTTRLESGGVALRQMTGVGSFCSVIVIPAMAAVKVPKSVDLRYASLLGCGVLTGVGAALNTASICQGDRVAVLGCGGVGLSIIQGARIAGATEIIAVDVVGDKLDLATRLGATSTVNAAHVADPARAVRELTSGLGADVSFEAIGVPATIRQAAAMTRRGGETVFVGVPRQDTQLDIPLFSGLIAPGRTLKGCWYGSAEVRRDIPRLLSLIQAGDLEIEPLVSRTISIKEINTALDMLDAGTVTRSVVLY